MLAKIHNLRRRERQSTNPRLNTHTSSHDFHQEVGEHCIGDSEFVVTNSDDVNKKQMILSTIADLKRSLESQSVELNGLNED